MSDMPRRPKGQPGGGQFAAKMRGEPQIPEQAVDPGEERISRLLSDLAQFAVDAESICAYGSDYYLGDSQESRLLRKSGSYLVVEVATVVEKLPADFKGARPDIPWCEVNRMRNLVAHHDNKVNHRLVWEVLRTRIPDMANRLGLR